MSENNEKLAVDSETLEPFVLCLALGVLEAMKTETWSTEAGIWTIRRPVFFEKLSKMNLSEQVINILDQFDELSALEELAGNEEVKTRIEEFEGIIKNRLKDFSETFWRATWLEKNE